MGGICVLLLYPTSLVIQDARPSATSWIITIASGILGYALGKRLDYAIYTAARRRGASHFAAVAGCWCYLPGLLVFALGGYSLSHYLYEIHRSPAVLAIYPTALAALAAFAAALQAD
jgi:uncharacterized membrane protein AbrB (regulator of aidB expression)